MSHQYLSETTPLNPVSITDFMALVQSLRNTRFAIFGDIAKSLPLTIFLKFQESNIIAVIPDQYNIRFD